MIRENIVKKQQPQRFAIEPKKVDNLIRVYRGSCALKEPESGISRSEFMASMEVLTDTNETFFDNLGFYQLQSGNTISSIVNSTLANMAFGSNTAEIINRFGQIFPMVIKNFSLAVADTSAGFTGTVEIIRQNAFGRSGSEFLDFNKAVNPKSEFGWFYEFKDVNWLVDNFFAINIDSPNEDIQMLFEYKLIRNSLIMRKC